MDDVTYATLSRQTGLMAEMQSLANNIANISTTGFRREGVTFAEFVARLGEGQDGLAMATPLARRIDTTQGELKPTGGALDMAILGDGYFLVQTPAGQQLTRDGAFSTDGNGNLVTMDGYQVLDSGGSTIFVPPDGQLKVGEDGTLSSNGDAIGQIGVVMPTDPNGLERAGAGLFTSSAGVEPVIEPVVRQGFVEGSNVNAVLEISRMIEVQHAYEQGQKFLDQEDERIRSVIRTLGQ